VTGDATDRVVGWLMWRHVAADHKTWVVHLFRA